MTDPRQDLTRTTLVVLFIGGLITAGFWVMEPFLPAIVWAATLVIATWPVMLQVQRHAGGRRGVAVLAMTLLLLLLLIVPLWLAVSTIVGNADVIVGQVRNLLAMQMPPPPHWLARLPLVGARAVDAWEHFTAGGTQALAAKLTPYAGQMTQWFASAAGSLGAVFLQVLLTVAIAATLYARGEKAAAIAIRFGGRMGGERGKVAVRLAGQAIRGVALGVVVTAVAQGVLGGVGLAIAGVPYAAVLTALMFMLCLAQIGPGLVLVPAVAWMYYADSAVWATVLLAFAGVAMTMDNVLRPWLIRKGADLPLLLILAGVIGGLLAIGLLGIFLGPTVLAIGYTLLNAWMAESDAAAPPADGSAARPDA